MLSLQQFQGKHFRQTQSWLIASSIFYHASIEILTKNINKVS